MKVHKYNGDGYVVFHGIFLYARLYILKFKKKNVCSNCLTLLTQQINKINHIV